MKLFAAFFALVFVVACTQQNNVQSVTGVSGAGIINGGAVGAGEPVASHVVAITDDKWENCTGTLIAKNLVLTAAHCETPGTPMYVAFGREVSEKNLKKVDRRQVVDYRLIPGRKSIDLNTQEKDLKDLMIVEFEGGLPAGYAPAEFLTDDSVLQNGTSVLLVGYGVTDGVKQEGDGLLRKTLAPILAADFADTEVQTDERRHGSCSIDSGGPAFVQVDGKWLIWGVTSRGDENCREFGIYTKVFSYKSWIDSVVQELGANSL